MIEISHGSIFESGCEALVNPVNCVGVMGKGLASEFKKRFPCYFTYYKVACSFGEMEIGHVSVYRHFIDHDKPFPLYLVSFPTKIHWRDRSQLLGIRDGLADLARFVAEKSISTIAIPAIGCGLGGLKWEDVLPLIESAFESLPHVRVVVYPPM